MVRSFDAQAGQATLEWLAVAVGVGGTLRGPRHGHAGRRAADHQRVPDPHLSRRRRVVRGLAPHRAARAGAAAHFEGSSSGGAPAQIRDGCAVAL